MYELALAVYDYAVTLPNVDIEKIVPMGFSLGTGCAVYLAAKRRVSGLILAAPYANGYDLYNNMVPIFFGPMRLLVKQKLPSDEYAPKVTCPVFIVASRSDEVVSFLSSEFLSKLFSGNVDFIILDDELHNHIFQGLGVMNKMQTFLEEIALN
jgi:dienelactone hydrolase